MSKPNTLSRRQFLKKSTLAAAAAIGAPMIIPSTAWAASALKLPGDRITMGIIGMGMLGEFTHLPGFLNNNDVQVIAICDVDRQKLANGVKKTNDHYAAAFGKPNWQGCSAYTDFREMLARPDLDAVAVVTPNHWHALLAIAAAKAGKDIYCEKPMALTIGETRAMVDAVHRYGRVLQVGSQQRSDPTFRYACELVRNGCIGTVREVFVNVGSPPVACYLPPEPTPDFLDWDMWLGPAPWRPYSSVLAPPMPNNHWPLWRDYRDYAGGGMTDFGAHHFDIAQWGLGMDHTGPVEVNPPDGKTYDRLTYRYANGVVMYHQGGDPRAAVTFVGDKGSVAVQRGSYLRTEPADLINTKFGPNDIHLYESHDHHQNFLDCVRSRQKPICDVEIGCRSASVCHIGNIAYWLKRPLKWNPDTERFVGDEEANRLLRRPMRAPWRL